jgi:hypothetical protein
MADNKDHIGEPERSRVAGSEEYEIRHFAEAIGLDVEKVRKLIERHGADRATLEREARKLTSH